MKRRDDNSDVCIRFTASLLIAISANFVAVPHSFAIPLWATQNTLKKDGAALTVVCSGQSTSLDFARQNALENCARTVSTQLSSTATVKTISIETEKSVAFHSEVFSEKSISGLKCDVLKDEVETTAQGITVWIKCKYDLSKVFVQERQSPPISADKQEQNIAIKQTKNNLRSDRKVSKQTFVQVGSVPMCSTILIRGSKPRMIQCPNNPTDIGIENGDEEIIVRAEGYQPKTMPIRVIWGGNANVVLDPID